MLDTQTCDVTCPYCGETIQVIVDPSIQEQNYIEDCFVCCKPINLIIRVSDTAQAYIKAIRDDDC